MQDEESRTRGKVAARADKHLAPAARPAWVLGAWADREPPCPSPPPPRALSKILCQSKGAICLSHGGWTLNLTDFVAQALPCRGISGAETKTWG